MKASDVKMRGGHSLDLQGPWADGDIPLLTHEMCYGGRVHAPIPVVCIHLVLKGAGELLSTAGACSQGAAPQEAGLGTSTVDPQLESPVKAKVCLNSPELQPLQSHGPFPAHWEFQPAQRRCRLAFL